MKDIRCMLGLHTGLTDSIYKYASHEDYREYPDMLGHGDIIVWYETKCARCGKMLSPQKFAFIWADEPFFSYEKTKEKALERAKEFTWNGV